jgi:hypothetical protein
MILLLLFLQKQSLAFSPDRFSVQKEDIIIIENLYHANGLPFKLREDYFPKRFDWTSIGPSGSSKFKTYQPCTSHAHE